MIRWDLTKKEFGTDEHNTKKLDWVIVECDKCGVQMKRKHAQHKQTMKNKGRYYCSDCAVKSNEFKNQCSIRAQEKWEHEEYRNNVITSTNTDEYRDKLSKTLKQKWDKEKKLKWSRKSKELWNNNEYRDKVTKRSKEIWNDDKKTSLSNHLKDRWKDDTYKEKMREVQIRNTKRMWKEKRDKLMEIFNSEEFKNKIKQMWENEAYRSIFKSDEFKEKSRKNSIIMWREHKSKMMSIFNSEQYREKMRNLWAIKCNELMEYFNSDEFAESCRNNSIKLWKEKRNKLMELFSSDEFKTKAKIMAHKMWEEKRCELMQIFSSDNYKKLVSDSVIKWREMHSEELEGDRIDRHNNFIKKANELHNGIYDYSEVNYIKNSECVEIICPVHGVFEQTPKGHIQGNRCPQCARQYGRSQNEVFDFVKNLGFDLRYNDRLKIHPLELDIFIPEKNIAIEYHGLYWHSFDKQETTEERNRHCHKLDKCIDNDIKLIQIFENEWLEKREIVESVLKSKLGISNKIYARKCSTKEINTKQHMDFMNQNHIQGGKGCDVAYGLKHNDELVAVMSFNKHKKYGWEITRFANKLDVTIVGGASKLFKQFIKDYIPGTILTYADRRYSNGNLYKKLGFKLDGITKPNYFYVKNNKIYSRQQFMKHKLKNRLEIFDPELTEAENMFNNGYRRLWDAGNYRFVYSIQK